MIRQTFSLGRYGWRVKVYYAVDCYYSDEIIEELREIGCRGNELFKAMRNLKGCTLDTGLTYSNYRTRDSVMVIGLTSSPAEFFNSLIHEMCHLGRHICAAVGIDPYGEEAAYLQGDIAQAMYSQAKKFLCECHLLYKRK